MSLWVVAVMRVTTLKASTDGLAGLISCYAGLAEDRGRPGAGRGPVDYYLDPDEPAGQWWGSGLGALGLGAELLELRLESEEVQAGQAGLGSLQERVVVGDRGGHAFRSVVLGAQRWPRKSASSTNQDRRHDER